MTEVPKNSYYILGEEAPKIGKELGDAYKAMEGVIKRHGEDAMITYLAVTDSADTVERTVPARDVLNYIGHMYITKDSKPELAALMMNKFKFSIVNKESAPAELPTS